MPDLGYKSLDDIPHDPHLPIDRQDVADVPDEEWEELEEPVEEDGELYYRDREGNYTIKEV